MNKDLTILVPTYNRFTYTRYTLDALAQYTDFSCVKEILVGDAGSTDGTRDLVEQYDFVSRVYDVPYGSVAHNIRRGAELANGKYVLMLCNDIIVSSDWNRKALEAIKFGEKHGVKIINYDMPDPDLDEAIVGRLMQNGARSYYLDKSGAPRSRIESEDFSLQETYQAGGLWIATKDLLLSKTPFGRLGDIDTNVYFGMWYWHVLSFQGHIAIRLPRLSCLLLENLPNIPSGSVYMKHRLEDPIVKDFLKNEDPVGLKKEYVDRGWMRDMNYQ